MQIRYARGEGTLLEGGSAPFHDVLARVATGVEVQAWLQRSAQRYAKLQLGELALIAGVPGLADARGFTGIPSYAASRGQARLTHSG